MFLWSRIFPRKPDKAWADKWKTCGIYFAEASHFLDYAYTTFVSTAYERTLYPKSFVLREIVKKCGGGFICEDPRQENEYDTLFIPFWFGKLIIQRPWINVRQIRWDGYQVIFTCTPLPNFIRKSLEASATQFLAHIFEKERILSKHMFIAYCKKVTGVKKDLPARTMERINHYFDFNVLPSLNGHPKRT